MLDDVVCEVEKRDFVRLSFNPIDPNIHHLLHAPRVDMTLVEKELTRLIDTVLGRVQPV